MNDEKAIILLRLDCPDIKNKYISTSKCECGNCLYCAWKHIKLRLEKLKNIEEACGD